MSLKPTTVSRLESTLCKRGYRSNGVVALHPDANDEGHKHYSDFMTMTFSEASIDFFERYTEDKVEMATTLTPEQLVRVAKVLADTHKSKRNQIKVEAIVTVTTAVAVCDVLK